jgi:glutathione S-transferase
MDIKLYYSPGSCSLAPHILLEEVGVPFTTEVVSVPEAKTQQPEHLQRNPKGRIPVLLVDGVYYTEVPAISYWIAGQKRELNLFPSEFERAVRLLEWFNWLKGPVHAVAFGEIWRPQRFVRDIALFPQITSAGRENALEAYEFIETQLKGRTWAVPDAFSMIDPYLLVYYRWGYRIDISMRERFPAWTEIIERVAQRPSVSRALAREGITIWPA